MPYVESWEGPVWFDEDLPPTLHLASGLLNDFDSLLARFTQEIPMTQPNDQINLSDMTAINIADINVLVAFKFGDSKTGGIVYGLRFGPPKNVKDAQDFPGTKYKVVTENNTGQKYIYRYVPITRIEAFLADTDSNAQMLDRVLGPIGDVPQESDTPQWQGGSRVRTTSGAEGVITDFGNIVWLDDGSLAGYDPAEIDYDLENGHLTLVS